MASETDSPFDGASPHAFGSNSSQDYEDLFMPTEDLDLLMPDVMELEDLPSQAPMSSHASNRNAHEPDIGAAQQNTAENTIGSCDRETTSVEKNGKEPKDVRVSKAARYRGGEAELTASEMSDRIKALLKDDGGKKEDASAEKQKPESPKEPSPGATDTEIIIKQEEKNSLPISDQGTPAEVIDLSDSVDVEEIPRHMRNYKYGTTMQDGTILLSDGEDDQEITIVYDDGSTAITNKQENPEVEFLGASKSLVDLPQSESSAEEEPVLAPKPKLGNSILRTPNPRVKRTPADIEQMKRMQRLYAARALGKRVVTGAGGIFRTPRTPQNPQTTDSNSSRHTDSDDTFAWMSDTVIQDENRGTGFLELKRVYKAKRKARKNTLVDDVEFKKAQREENDRIRKLAQETADSESDEAEESDDGLFVSQREPTSSFLKRPFGSIIGDFDDADDEVAGTDKPAPKKQKNNVPSNKVDYSNKRARAKALEKETRSNMMAGIEAYLLRDQKNAEDKAAKEAEIEDAKNGKGRKKGLKKKKGGKNAKKVLPTRTATGRMNNVGSLLTSNVYDDSNANLDCNSLPVITEKKKKDFLSSLIANVPLEDQKQARSDRIDVVRASKILSPRNVKPDGKGDWHLTGMKTSLYHYQVQGAAYMKKRETGDQEPCGGILADQMGLGKTVMMIATMIANRATQENEPKCTLIVCSPALMTQWEREIKIHAEGTFGRIARHHANTKYSGLGAEMEMERADIILTTYGEVVRSYPKCTLPKDIKDPAKKEEWWLKEWDEERGLLHRAQFYRVVLDEAQVIKNHTSQTSIACRALMAKHRWAISGTPIQNRLDELFPYFKFLRVRHTGSIAVFRQNFCIKDSDVCNKRLHSMLEGLMIRRTHQNKLFGVPLVQLPKNTQATIPLKFTAVEMAIYQRVKARCIRAINAFARYGTPEETPEEHTKMIMIMFQRLRQMVAHIFMAQEVMEKEYTVYDVDEMLKTFGKSHEVDSLEMKMLTSMRGMIEAKGEVPEETQEADIVPPPEENPKSLKVGKSGTLTARFGTFLRQLKNKSKWGELKDRTCCQKCGAPPEEPLVMNCLHVYCKECLEHMAYEAAAHDMDETACAKCGTAYTECQSCDGLKELEYPDLSASMFQKPDGAQPEKKYKLTMNWVDSDDELLLSTKLIAVKEQLEKWVVESPDTKIIVFTEWHMVMHILGRICQQKKWKCCHYNGKMNNRSRDRALNAFQDDDDLKIMIASLKCGGTGLNLTAASKVICVDLWFNSCVEEQAFCRVHRIGQKSETYITRFMVAGTVDERLIEMQKEKKEVIDAAIDDRTVMSKLSVTELMKLFGPVAYDENSRPFILVDDDISAKRPAAPTAGDTPSSSRK